MPIYEYQCKDCNHRLEALQKISDGPLTVCPACSRAGLVRLVSASSFRLKGGGWYETDFKTGNKKHGTQDADSGSGAVAPKEATEPAKAASPASGATAAPAVSAASKAPAA